MHELDVVPVGVEHKCAVVTRVIDRSLARRPVVTVPSGDESSVVVVDHRVLVRGKGHVDVLAGNPGHEREGSVAVRELRSFSRLELEPETGVRSDALVGQLQHGMDGAGASNTFAGSSVLSLVVEVDKALVTGGGPIVGVWGSTHAAE